MSTFTASPSPLAPACRPRRGEAGELHKAGERFESASSPALENILMALLLHRGCVRQQQGGFAGTL